jgi:membrane fusion protein, multidrug efflux system
MNMDGVNIDTPTDTVEVQTGRRERLRRPLMIGGPALLLIFLAYWFFTGGRYETTDDAFVQTARVAISANISGRVIDIAVHDNQQVRKGDVLFRIEDNLFQITANEAAAELATARLQVDMLKANYRQRQAEEKSAHDTLIYNTYQLQRQQRLHTAGITSQVQVERSRHALQEASAANSAAQQQLKAVMASLGGNFDIAPDQHPTVQQAQAAYERAKLNLSYTVIYAPSDGVVTKVEQLQAGSYINAATPAFALLATGNNWIEANFKEDQLTYIRPGQSATVDIDIYPNKTFKAKVMSLSPGTGTQFSLLPPENATGNWVKVVQRLPVRLELQDSMAEYPLQSGLSVTVRIDTGHRRRLFGDPQ